MLSLNEHIVKYKLRRSGLRDITIKYKKPYIIRILPDENLNFEIVVDNKRNAMI